MSGANNRSYWFKRRRYGYGWTPVTWQGWLSVIGFLAVVVLAATTPEESPRGTDSSALLVYSGLIIIAVVWLVIVSSAKGPKPKWRWGSKPTDNPDEDI